MKYKLITLVFLLSNMCAYAQIMKSKYDRQYVSYILLNDISSESIILRNSLKYVGDVVIEPSLLPGNLDILSPDGTDISGVISLPKDKLLNEERKVEEALNKISSRLSANTYSDFNEALKKQNLIGNLMAGLLIDNKGNLNLEKLFSKGEYNATDAEVLISRYAKEGSSIIKNTGFDIINRLNLVVISMGGYFDKELNYINKDKETFPHYYTMTLKVKIDNNDFWGKVYDVNSGKVNKSALLNYDYQLEYISKVKSKNIKGVITKTSRRYKIFRPSSSIMSTSPISSKLGTKEGLRKNDLFEVLENKMDKDGEIVQKRLGYVRVKSVANNDGNSTGSSNTSVFYKTFSSSVDKGMILRSIPQRGVGIGFSKNIPSSSSSLVNGWLYQIDYYSHKSKGLKFSLGFGLTDTLKSSNIIYHDNKIKNADTTVVSTGLNTEFLISKTIQLNFIEISPALGFYMGSYIVDHSLSGNKKIEGPFRNSYDGFVANSPIGAIKIGINLGRNIQVYGMYKHFFTDTFKLTVGSTSSYDPVKQTEPINVPRLQFANSYGWNIGIRLLGL